METNTASMPTGIRPIERPQGPQTTGIQRRGGVTTSPFAPRTDVSLQNSVADVANLLSKIASTKEEATDELSPQLQKLVDNIMKQSFSLESTLAEGLGTTLENQRFAIDQMFTLSRLLHQMGTLSEQGKPAALNDQMQALLANFREVVVTDEGKDMTPIMLHKLAFDVLDGKTAAELPDMMQFMLAQQGLQSAFVPEGESDTFAFMKQLMDYFMPRPGTGEAAHPTTGEQSVPQQGESAVPQQTQTAAGESVGTEPQGEASGGAAPQTMGRQDGAEGARPTMQNGQSSQNIQSTPAAQGGQPTQNVQMEPTPQGGQPMQNMQNGATPQGGQASQNASNGSTPQNGQPAQNTQAGTAAQGGQPAQNVQTGVTPQSGQPMQSTQTGTTPQGGQTAQNTQTEPTVQNTSSQTRTESFSARSAEKSSATAYTWERSETGAQAESGQSVEVNPQDPFAELMRKGLERMRGRLQQTAQADQNEQEPLPTPTFSGRTPEPPSMQNTPQTMDAMKKLASFLLKDAALTSEDEQLLTDFVNNRQTMLSEREAKELQMLLRLCEKNVPASVQNSAQQKGMEDMPRLWAFMELCDLALIRERDPKALKRASKSLSDFASMMKNSMLPENGRTAEGHRSMSFMTPLYMTDDMQKPYPAYIHVYDEEQKDESGGSPKKETWIRVCLLTDNIGAVDVSFRMYEGSNLDVRIYFSERENIEEFRDYMDEFRASFEDKPLTLMSVKVGVAGAKT